MAIKFKVLMRKIMNLYLFTYSKIIPNVFSLGCLNNNKLLSSSEVYCCHCYRCFGSPHYSTIHPSSIEFLPERVGT